MRVVRMFAALITVVGLIFAGGCGSSAPPATSTAAAPADPREQLSAGIRAVNSGPFRLVEKTTAERVTFHLEGGFDPARHAARIQRSESVSGKTTDLDYVTLGTDVYVRYGEAFAGVPAGRWMHIDGRRLKSLRALGIDGDDMTGKLGLAGAVTTVERTAPRELRGTYDTAKVAGALPGTAGSASWQARFDERNRLVWMAVEVPAAGGAPALTVDSAYSRFGEPVTVDRPAAGSTVDAPAPLYRALDR